MLALSQCAGPYTCVGGWATREAVASGTWDSLESMPHRPSAVRDGRNGSRTEASDSEAEASEATGTLRPALAQPDRV